MYIRILLSLTAICLSFSFSYAQKATLEKQIEKLHNYSRNRPEEKVYLHFDKDYYVAGETVWFKSYTTIGADHLPSAQSEFLYVDLYDQQNNFIDQLWIHSKNGFGQGHFDLPSGLEGSQLKVKAYTNWMKNFNMDFIFQKGLRIITTNEKTTTQTISASVDFYPEGGDLIAGITNRVAIKTNLSLGDNAFRLTDSDQNELKEVEINEKGYGQFVLKPDPEEVYFLNYNGEQFQLPQPVEQGISITLNSYSYADNARLTLRKTSDTKLDKASIMVHTRGTVHYASQIDFSRAAAITNIPKGTLPAGVNHLTIFDQEGKPLAERLFYIDRTDAVTMDIGIPPEAVTTRKKVSIDLDLSAIADNSDLQSNLSFTATQRSNISNNPLGENIKTYLLLNSDLRGQIENPGYYFSNQSKERKQALDLVMMTHGWRRFTWDKVLEQPLDSIKYEPERGLTIEGRMLSLGNDKPVVGGTVTYINNQNGQMTMRNEVTDENGAFILRDLIHSEESVVNIKGVNSQQGLKRKGKQAVVFEIDTLVEITATPWLAGPEAESMVTQTGNQQILEEAQTRALYDSIYNFDPDVRIVQGVTVEAKEQESQFEVSPIYGKGTETVTIPQEARAENYRDIFSYLQGKVPGLFIIPSLLPGDAYVQIRSNVRIGTPQRQNDGTIVGGTGILPPKFVLNDMQSDKTTIGNIPVAQISRVEIFKGPDAVAHGLNTIGGVIAVYTKTGYDFIETAEVEEGLYTMKLPGFQASREFFSPDYASAKPEHAKPDVRSLLHWQPFVETNSTGHATIEFWTSDNTGIIDINIQGITYDGKPLAMTTFIEVKEEDEQQ